jgi:hypothetical protein
MLNFIWEDEFERAGGSGLIPPADRLRHRMVGNKKMRIGKCYRIGVASHCP